MGGQQTNSSKSPGIVSPKFSHAAKKPNPDGSLTPSSGIGATMGSPVLQNSISPTTAATKSIMNASGTSGAVVSNTPEPGLKRVPTVTFSDSRHITLKQQAVANAAANPNKAGSGEEQEKAGLCSPQMKTTSPTMGTVSNLRNPSPPPLVGSEQGAQTHPRPTSPGVTVRPEGKKNMISKILHSADVLHHNGDHATTSPPASIVESEPKKDDGEGHAHFYVDDVLHSPGFRSRSNSLSPMPQAGTTPPHIPNDKKLEAIRQQEPTIIESPDEAAEFMAPELLSTSQQVAPNIPKRESGKNCDPRLPQDDGKLHVLFGATGSLSVLKIKAIIKKLEEIYGRDKISIQLILTQAAAQFFNPKTKKAKNDTRTGLETPVAVGSLLAGENAASKTQGQMPTSTTHGSNISLLSPANNAAASKIELPPHIQVWTDQDEWDVWKQRTDPVLHIELRRWADILVVAPLTANTLSKIALGLCDNLLTSLIRAWNPMFPIFLAPSMVSSSYNSTITKRHLKMIKEEMPWITVFKPSEKVMGIHGEIGLGGMMDANEIVDKVVMKLGGYPKDGDEEEEEEEEEEEDDEDDDDEKKQKGQENTLLDEDEDDEEDEDDDDDEDDDEDEDDVQPTEENNVASKQNNPAPETSVN